MPNDAPICPQCGQEGNNKNADGLCDYCLEVYKDEWYEEMIEEWQKEMERDVR
jgi:hypothetical protein